MIRLLLLICFTAMVGGVTVAAVRAPIEAPADVLPPIAAVGVTYDTLLFGGYAAGTFTEAVRILDAGLSAEERTLVGQHLDRIFANVLVGDGLGRTGRLRVALERTLRPDGTPRALRVLGAEVAVAGRLYTGYYFEREGLPSYYDALGRSLDENSWDGPLPRVRVTSAFGARRMHPILNRILPHTGVDLAAAAGDPVRATADGIVVSSGTRGGYGLLVEIQHPNGYSTRYAHLSGIVEGVRPSSAVRRGDVIGYVGMTGLATGPHLHYEVRRRGEPVDPLRLGWDPALATWLDTEADWPIERRRIGELLARAPTLSQARTN